MNTIDNRWDIVVRTCHWLIVILVALQFATAEFDLLSMDWHFWFGYALLGLLGLRLAWGFIGPPSARFANSLHGPRALIDYLRRFRERKSHEYVGHNPLGALAVFALFAVLLVQSVSGLLTSDEILLEGPLVQYWPEWERTASRIHHLARNVLLALVALHVLAVLLYRLVKREDLIGAMWHGRRRPE